MKKKNNNSLNFKSTVQNLITYTPGMAAKIEKQSMTIQLDFEKKIIFV